MNNRIAAFLTFAFTLLVACVAFAEGKTPVKRRKPSSGPGDILAVGHRCGLAIGIAAAGGGIGQVAQPLPPSKASPVTQAPLVSSTAR